MRHPVDDYKNWQPKFASYALNKFPRRKAQAQAIKEMSSEAAEVMAIVTKADRKDKEYDRERVLDETSDTLWGLVGIMNTFGFSWSELCDYNMAKLEKRFKEEPKKW